MTRARDLQSLAQLTAVVFSTEQARMGILRQSEQTLRVRLDALDSSRKARANSLTEADPALIAGADLLWQSWIEQRRAALNAELSRNLVLQEAARAALRQAFGRDQATQVLSARAKLIRNKARNRQDDYHPDDSDLSS